VTITPNQSRAARGLLGWTQDKLANNARISRATVAEFEANTHRPMKNNLLAIEDCMYAAGIEFIPERGTEGVGVRFREPKLQYSPTITIDPSNSSALFHMAYGGREFTCIVPCKVLEDNRRGDLKSDEEIRNAASEMLHHILAAAEHRMKAGFDGERLVLSSGMFDPSLQ